VPSFVTELVALKEKEAADLKAKKAEPKKSSPELEDLKQRRIKRLNLWINQLSELIKNPKYAPLKALIKGGVEKDVTLEEFKKFIENDLASTDLKGSDYKDLINQISNLYTQFQASAKHTNPLQQKLETLRQSLSKLKNKLEGLGARLKSLKTKLS
jgi:hypothetical protein